MGADELVFLDITASHEKRDLIVDVARVAEQVFIPFTVGGSIRTVADFRGILRAGADKCREHCRSKRPRNPSAAPPNSSVLNVWL